MVERYLEYSHSGRGGGYKYDNFSSLAATAIQAKSIETACITSAETNER